MVIMAVLHHHGLVPGEREGDAVLPPAVNRLQRKVRRSVTIPQCTACNALKREGSMHLAVLRVAEDVHGAGLDAVRFGPSVKSEAAPLATAVSSGQRAIIPASQQHSMLYSTSDIIS